MRKILNQLVFCMLLTLTYYSCTPLITIQRNINKIEIVKIDSTDFHYVFSTNNKKNSLVIGEKEKFKECLSTKKYIIKDSIKETPILKEGNTNTYIGFFGFEAEGVMVKNAGELVKYIDNCEALF